MNLVYVKDIDKSLLFQGFTIRSSFLQAFIENFGKLAIGETRPITIKFQGQYFSEIQVINQNFNRKKYADHVEMYQVRYNPTNGFAKALRNAFPELTAYVQTQQQLREQMRKKGEKPSNIKIPEELRCSIAFYETTTKNCWEAIPVFSQDFRSVKENIKEYTTDEMAYEESLLNDENADLVCEQRWVKIRKLDRHVCLNLKKLYQYRCQVCGELITAPYASGDEKVIDAHHIDPFTKSLNNNFSNIMILCPNHHRVIHACHPDFSRTKKELIFPNGYHEKLKLNLHL